MNRVAVSPKRMVVAGVLGLAAVATYGFAAGNTVATSNAGDGHAPVSRPVVSDVHYTLDTLDPSIVREVTFNVTPPLQAGGSTRISIDSGATWLGPGACIGTSNVACTSAVPATQLSGLRVVAAQ